VTDSYYELKETQSHVATSDLRVIRKVTSMYQLKLCKRQQGDGSQGQLGDWLHTEIASLTFITAVTNTLSI